MTGVGENGLDDDVLTARATASRRMRRRSAGARRGRVDAKPGRGPSGVRLRHAAPDDTEGKKDPDDCYNQPNGDFTPKRWTEHDRGPAWQPAPIHCVTIGHRVVARAGRAHPGRSDRLRAAACIGRVVRAKMHHPRVVGLVRSGGRKRGAHAKTNGKRHDRHNKQLLHCNSPVGGLTDAADRLIGFIGNRFSGTGRPWDTNLVRRTRSVVEMEHGSGAVVTPSLHLYRLV